MSSNSQTLPTDASCPLVSFVVFAYQQERYVRDAVKGALEQSYSPLEIILSDDGSTDRTFEIMTEMARGYHGPHTVVLNRNSTNLGMGEHVNRCMELAQGELIVAAAGDDVSVRHRTEYLVKKWMESGRPLGSVHSAYMVIDEEGREYGARQASQAGIRDNLLTLCDRQMSGVVGATNAWHRAVFEKFGPLNADVAYEDQIIPVRSRLIGDVIFEAAPLVYYRRAEGCITFPGQNLGVKERRKQKRLHQQRWMAVYRQWEQDFEKAPQPPIGYKRMVEYLKARSRFEIAMHEAGFFLRFRSFLHAMRYRENWRRCMLVYPWYAIWGIGDLWVKHASFGNGWHELLAQGVTSKD